MWWELQLLTKAGPDPGDCQLLLPHRKEALPLATSLMKSTLASHGLLYALKQSRAGCLCDVHYSLFVRVHARVEARGHVKYFPQVLLYYISIYCVCVYVGMCM